MILTLTPLLFCIVGIASFGCGLAGTGPSLVIISLIQHLGVSFAVARGIGMMVNIASLGAVSIQSIRGGQLDLSSCAVMTGVSIATAPLGALAGPYFSDAMLNGMLMVYMLAALTYLTFFRVKEKSTRERGSLFMLGCLGGASGLVAGLLGIGGGGVVIPSMLALGFDLKRAAVTNAFIVCCSSMVGLSTILTIGDFDAVSALPLALIAFVGGYLGTRVMHARLSQETVRRLVVLIFGVLSVKQLVALIFS